ncbi:MAG: PH domain-containing protein [Chloroflexi bacterium]|nr:PH domain-containing protein [Chloroflexota bacterium]
MAPSTTITATLHPSERLLWQGQPEPRAYALRGAWYLIPFSPLWGGFAIFWEVSAVAMGAPIFFMLWGIPFVAIGLYLIFGRIPLARREASRTHYAVTDQRIVILSGGARPRLIQMAIEDLPPAQLEIGSLGSGTITFGSQVGVRLPPGWPTFGMYAQAPAFLFIADAGRVFHILQDAKSAARPR